MRKTTANKNLRYLAFQLASNQFITSVYDFMDKYEQKKMNDSKWDARFSKVLKTPVNFIPGEVYHPDGKLSLKEEDIFSTGRNVLVIGAGATYNSFKNIKLADGAIAELLEKLIIATKENTNGEPLTFKYFISYYEIFISTISMEEVRLEKASSKKSKLEHNLKKQNVNSEALNKYIWNNLLQENSILHGLGQKYLSEINLARFYQSDFLKKDSLEFETVLNTLTKIFPSSSIRSAIKSIYDHQHGPTMFYHIITHLFKHRFIDAIINFNFDEILDEIIEEELGKSGYDKVISDGDCVAIKQLEKFGRLRQPLYIKPHGTASHKSSLRFTKEHYHELPHDMRAFLKDLLNSEKEELPKRLNLITIGYNMGSIEFNEILSETLSKNSQIFSFYYHDNSRSNFKESEITNSLKSIFQRLFDKKNFPKVLFIGHEHYKDLVSEDLDHLGEFRFEGSFGTLGNLALSLFDKVSTCFKPYFKPREIYRHITICMLFGNPMFHEMLYVKPTRTTPAFYPTDYFKSADYFLDRLIVEIMLSFSINQGRVSPVELMRSRAGRYYSKYYDKLKESDTRVLTLGEILNLIGLSSQNSNNLFTELKFQFDEANFKHPRVIVKNVFDHIYVKKRKLFSKKLRSFLNLIDKEHRNTKHKLEFGFWKVFETDNSSIQSELRNPNYHVFSDFGVSDLLTTETALSYNYFKAITKENINCICIVADFGYLFSRYMDLIKESKIEVFLILQKLGGNSAEKKPDYQSEEKANKKISFANLKLFRKNFSNEKLNLDEDEWFTNQVHIRFLEIEQHNDHLVMFLNRKDPKHDDFGISEMAKSSIKRTIFYPKPGLSNHINPIRLRNKENQEMVYQLFGRLWEKSKHTFS